MYCCEGVFEMQRFFKVRYRRNLFCLLSFAILICVSICAAEIKLYEGFGQYVMSDFENQETAKQRARARAEQAAKDKAGVYLAGYSRSQNFQLAENEISTITNNIINIVGEVQYERKFENVAGLPVVIYSAKLQANIDTDGIQDWLNLSDEEKILAVAQNNSLQKMFAENESQNENLKQKYKSASNEQDKLKIQNEIESGNQLFLAMQKFREGDYNSALDLANKAISMNPNNIEAYILRGNAYQEFENHGQAIADFSKVIQLDKKNAEAYILRGNSYAELGKFEKAVDDYTAAIKIDSKNIMAYNNRGLIYSEMGHLHLSQADLKKAAELAEINSPAKKSGGKDSTKAKVYYNLGREYDVANLGDYGSYKDAIEYYNKAIQADSNFIDAYVDLSWVYVKKREFDKAIDLASNVIQRGKKDKNTALAYYIRGICYLSLGDKAKADSDFQARNKIGDVESLFYDRLSEANSTMVDLYAEQLKREGNSN